MHPLRALLFLSVGIAAAVAGAFGYLLHRAGVSEAGATFLGACVFVAFMLPWSGVFTWALRRASDLDTLTDRTRDFEHPIHDREYHGELDDLGRGIEDLRVALMRERAWSQEQRGTMQQIAASLGEGLLAVSPRGRIVLANERVNEMFGMQGAIIGRTLPEVARSQPLLAAFDHALKGEQSTSQSRIGERLIEIRAFPVAASTEVAAVALLIDITQLDRLQKIRSEFLDDFSHEVRTPLAGLRSAVETFEQGGLSGDNEEKLRQVMARQLARIERLVQEISELNRIETGDHEAPGPPARRLDSGTQPAGAGRNVRGQVAGVRRIEFARFPRRPLGQVSTDSPRGEVLRRLQGDGRSAPRRRETARRDARDRSPVHGQGPRD